MSLTKLPRFVRHVLVVHECLRMLGFSADDIYRVVRQDPQGWKVIVVLRAQGKTFVVDVARFSAADKTLVADQMQAGADAYTKASDAEIKRLFEEFFAAQPPGWRAAFITGIMGKGITIPAVAADPALTPQ